MLEVRKNKSCCLRIPQTSKYIAYFVGHKTRFADYNSMVVESRLQNVYKKYSLKLIKRTVITERT